MAQQVTVDSLLAEKARLEEVIEEAKSARTTITLINRMLTIYGGAPAGKGGVVEYDTVVDTVACPECGEFFKAQGLTVHRRRMHGANGEAHGHSEGPVGCPECDKYFGSSRLVGDHMRKVHNIFGGLSGRTRA